MQLEIFLKSSVYCTSFKDLYWKLCKYEEAYYYDFPLYTKGWHEIFMSINSFVILTYCLSDLINFIQFQFYYRPCHLMMARVIVLLACIFILSKSKLLLVVGRNFIKIKFFKAFRIFDWDYWALHWPKETYFSPSCFEAHVGLFSLLMKWIFDPYVLWP